MKGSNKKINSATNAIDNIINEADNLSSLTDSILNEDYQNISSMSLFNDDSDESSSRDDEVPSKMIVPRDLNKSIDLEVTRLLEVSKQLPNNKAIVNVPFKQVHKSKTSEPVVISRNLQSVYNITSESDDNDVPSMMTGTCNLINSNDVPNAETDNSSHCLSSSQSTSIQKIYDSLHNNNGFIELNQSILSM
jgi:hypothetical protein